MTKLCDDRKRITKYNKRAMQLPGDFGNGNAIIFIKNQFSMYLFGILLFGCTLKWY